MQKHIKIDTKITNKCKTIAELELYKKLLLLQKNDLVEYKINLADLTQDEDLDCEEIEVKIEDLTVEFFNQTIKKLVDFGADLNIKLFTFEVCNNQLIIKKNNKQ